MPHTAIIARLDSGVAALKTVGGSVEFAGIETAPKQYPAAYVLPSADKSGPNALCNGVEQHSVLRFSVAVCVQNVKGPDGEAGLAALKTVRAAIDAALLGWEPLAGYDTITHDSGRLLKIGNGALWWMDEYLTGYYRRN